MGFLLGLLTGLALLAWYRARLGIQLKRVVRHLQPSLSVSAFSSEAQIMAAVSDYQAASVQLEQQIETWRQILHACPSGYLQVDEDNQMLWCNSVACRLLEIQSHQLTKPRLLLELVRSYELDHLIEQTRLAQHPRQAEWVFYPSAADPIAGSPQPATRPLRGYAIPLREGQVGVFLEDRQEAVTLAQQRDRWASDVAHELKTPLTSIRLVAETLEPRVPPPLQDWIKRLLGEVIRLSTLVQELLDLSQLELNPGQRLTRRTVDLAKLIRAAWSSLEPLSSRKSLQLAYVGPEHFWLQADETHLYRVLINLLDNGIKYSPRVGTIQVRLTPQPSPTISGAQLGKVLLEVIDAGPGFPETSLPYVFERFYRADPSRARDTVTKPGAFEETLSPATHIVVVAAEDLSSQPSHTDVTYPQMSQPGSGSGLGLAIVRQIVEAHQGKVKASNHPETGGGWLQVWLPWEAEGLPKEEVG